MALLKNFVYVLLYFIVLIAVWVTLQYYFWISSWFTVTIVTLSLWIAFIITSEQWKL